MKFEVKVPSVGESITEVIIAEWLKKDGDFVNADDLICEIESDKASFEIPAENSGILRIIAKAEETLEIGAVIAEIDGSGSESASKSAPNETSETSVVDVEPTAETSSETNEVFEIVVPTVGESITEVTIAEWLIADGATVNKNDLICEIESDKASFEIPSEYSGILKQMVPAETTVNVGDVIAKISGSASNASTTTVTEPSQPKPESSSPNDSKARVTHVAAKMLGETGISPNEINGSGPGGKITKEDVQKAIDNRNANPSVAAQETPVTAEPLPENTSEDRSTRTERMSMLRKTIAKRLVSAKNETAMLTTFNEADMSAIMALRKQYKEVFKEKHEVGLGFMSFFSKAVSLAIRDWPAINGMIDGNNIIYHDYVDISIAVSTPRGLVVPVIRNVDKLNLAGIEKEVVRLATRARDNKLGIDEMTGGTFTITNGGVFGSLLSTPIINQPQSAILGMHKIQQRPVAENGQVVIKPMMYLAVSYDHRIIDGRESVGFLVRVKELLEDPSRMFLEV